MNIIDYIKEIFSDINEDIENINEDQKENGALFGRRSYRRDASGFYVLLIPQLIGVVIGLAFARLFGMGAAGYFILALLFALAVGTFKSYEFDKIALRPAIIRNVIIMLMFAVLLGFAMLCA